MSIISYIHLNAVPTNTDVADLKKVEQENIEQFCWFAHKIRRLWKVSFIVLRTNTSTVQIVIEWDQLDKTAHLREWDYLSIDWKIVLNPKAWVNGIEILAKDIKKISGPIGELAINISSKVNANLDVVLDQRVLTLRNLDIRAVFKIQEGICRWFREFLLENNFTEIHTPKIVKAWAEGGANIFGLDYFGTPAFLAQSPQFYKQYMVPVFWRVFEIWPVFRAEKHWTSRHLNEYTSMDIEMGPINSFRDIMATEVGLLHYIISLLTTEYAEELKLLKIELPDISLWIPEVRFEDIKQVIAQKYNRPFRDKFDLEPEEERLIGQYIKAETGSDFVFITNYPEKKRPFYTMLSGDNPEYTEGFDLLFKGLEITTGGQRIHDYTMQVERMKEKGLSPNDFNDYLELHKNGTMPHGWFGIWLERLTQKLIWFNNIREATLFPRDINRLTP